MSETGIEYVVQSLTFDERLDALLEDGAAPAWAMPLLEDLRHASTYQLYHVRADLRLIERIMAETGPRDIGIWAEDATQLPNWARQALAAYLHGGQGFDRMRKISDVQMLRALVTYRLGFEE